MAASPIEISFPEGTTPLVVPPAYLLVEVLDEHEQSHRAVADSLGMDAWTFIRFLGGHVEVTPRLADRLEALTGVPDRVWLDREQQWRAVAGPAEVEGSPIPVQGGEVEDAYLAWR